MLLCRQVHRFYSNININSCKEIKIPVPWGYIAAKWWNPSNQRPIIAVHGWLDSAGSFDRLIPKLNRNVGVLAIDLPGQGYSSHLPPHMFYTFVRDAYSIKLITDYFKWSRVSLFGHSMGGAASFLYAMMYPKSLDFLIAFEYYKPFHSSKPFIDMAEAFNGFGKLDKDPACYSLEELRYKHAMGKSINLDCAHHIFQRNVKASEIHPNKYYWTRDRRLKNIITMKWTDHEFIDGASRITCPILMIKFTRSGVYQKNSEYYDAVRYLQKSSPDCRFHTVEGTHHGHLNNPENCAGLINTFLDDYYDSQNRDGGEILQTFLN